jgi:hypothetical protein
MNPGVIRRLTTRRKPSSFLRRSPQAGAREVDQRVDRVLHGEIAHRFRDLLRRVPQSVDRSNQEFFVRSHSNGVGSKALPATSEYSLTGKQISFRSKTACKHDHSVYSRALFQLFCSSQAAHLSVVSKSFVTDEFSGIDYTEKLKNISVSKPINHGDDDQIAPPKSILREITRARADRSSSSGDAAT